MIKIFKPAVICLLIFTALSPFNQLFAQGRQITGTVTSSENKLPAAGVSVTVKGTKTAVTTDGQGKYKITVEAKATTLVFSSASFISYEAVINGRTVIDVELLPDLKALEDVVIVGYSSVKRKELTASVSSIGTKELKDNPSNSAAEALAGKLAGVQVNVSEGTPGADVDIFVRGRGSITQSAAPLYIVDGIQVENALSVLSPQDIENVTVLKDAASTAIYGARGANGVFIITTKGGKNTGGKSKYSLERAGCRCI